MNKEQLSPDKTGVELEEPKVTVSVEPEEDKLKKTAKDNYAKTAKELRREERERVRAYRAQQKAEKIQAKNSRPVRRVGTFTMGLTLILTGIFVAYWLFFPVENITFVVYFVPIILILLGGEIFYNYFFHQNDRLKYDFMSGIICFCMICGCLGLAALPIAYEYYGPDRYITETRLEQDIYHICYEQLKNRNDIASLHTQVSLQRVTFEKDMSYSQLIPSDYVEISVRLKNQFRDKQSFAAACKEITADINKSGVPYRGLQFSTAGETAYDLYLPNEKFMQSSSVGELAERVGVSQ